MDIINMNALWLAVGAVSFLPKLHEVENYSMDTEQLNTLRLQETMFVSSVVVGGILASVASKKTTPFGIAAISAFVVLAIYEGKANGYAVS